MKKIFIIALVIIAFLGWKLPIQKQEEPSVGGDTVLPAGLVTYNLSGSGVSSSGTSIGLTSLTIPQNGYELQDADFSDTFYVTIEPGSKTRQEFVSCTTVTQNADNSATLSGCTRGLSPISPFTASTSLQFAHSGGSNVVFSNPPQLYNLYSAKGNDETITGLWQFNTSLPRSSLTATVDSEFITLGQANLIGNQGAATATQSVAGIVEEATALEAASSTQFDANNPHYLSSEYATDTPTQSTASASKVVMSDLTGYIKQGWLNLTELFTLTGGFTSTGTTTISASSTSTNPLKLNGLAYKFFGTRRASSTVLMEDGTGGLDFQRYHNYYGSSAIAAVNEGGYSTASIPTGTEYMIIRWTCLHDSGKPALYGNMWISVFPQGLVVRDTVGYDQAGSTHSFVEASTTSSNLITFGLPVASSITATCQEGTVYFYR